MSNILDYLKNKQLVWQGNQEDMCLAASPSGYPELDAHLDGGLPEQGIIDIQSDTGIGELRLFLPYLLRREAQQQGLLAIVGAPLRINSETLAEAGFDLAQVLILQPNNAQEALWAVEQCLKSGCCHSVLAWHRPLQVHQVKRLQLAAKQGGSLCLMFRQQQQSISLPVTMAVQLAAHSQGISVQVNKRVGSWNNNGINLDMRQHWPALTLAGADTARKADNLIPFPQKRVG